jgi:hypothetical protein
MKTLAIDRFEGNYAICEDDEKKMFAIEIEELPKGAKEGDVLEITDEGEVSINAQLTAARRAKVKKMQDSLWI